MEAAEEDRIEKLKGFFKAFTESQRVIMPIINQCLEGMDVAADTCDPKKVRLTLYRESCVIGRQGEERWMFSCRISAYRFSLLSFFEFPW